MKRALAFIVIGFSVFVGAGALSASRACAHDPRFACSPRGVNHPIVVVNPKKSWAFYGHLAVGQEDRYVVETRRALTVPVQILIDQRDAPNPARPVAIVADPSGKTFARIDLARMERFFEPFSRVAYLQGPYRLVRFPPGVSTITVIMRGDAISPQRYVLALGTDERFSAFEIPYLFGAAYRIHMRAY